MKKEVKDFVATSNLCLQNKSETYACLGLLQPLPIPQQVWNDISMDFIEGLPKSDHFDIIMLMVYRFTK